jgi:hypothetical protein
MLLGRRAHVNKISAVAKSKRISPNDSAQTPLTHSHPPCWHARHAGSCVVVSNGLGSGSSGGERGAVIAGGVGRACKVPLFVKSIEFGSIVPIFSRKMSILRPEIEHINFQSLF